MNIAERRIPQDGRITKIYNNETYDFRVSTLPTSFGEKIVIRILDTKAFNYDRSKLGFLPEENLIVDELLKKPYGIILLTGPTGCGKSTTLYSFIKEMNNESVNVITVEDPVEYTISGVNQVQVNNKANLTFASALRSILRQDPNIVMVGEIRDEYDSDEQDDITRINDYEYIVLGSANLEDVSDELGLHLESDDYDTIGGYCLEKLDHLPEKNEIIITDDNILLRIEAVDKNRIEKVYIKLPRPAEEGN